jgi:hypothetical protein
MRFSRSNLTLIALNIVWLTVLSVWLARRGELAKPEVRVEYVTNFAAVERSSASILVTNLVATNDFRWSQLESEDYRAYITRLRSIGCPEQTIRDIVIADIDKLLAPRMQAANPRTREITFWQPIEQELWEDAEQKDALQKQRAVDFEKREVIRELLGVDLVGERLRNQGQDDYYGQRLAFLPEEKRARVRLALDQFADQERALLEQQVEETDTIASSDELAQLHQQKNAALTTLLTPQEREQYDLWFSPAASRVRDSVYGMNATQDEFLKLYQLQREIDAQSGGQVTEQTWAEHQAKVRATLGESRYAEYVRAQDADYRALLRVTSRFSLGPEVAAKLYSYKEAVEQERSRVDAEPNLTPQQRSAAFEAIEAETQRALRQTLGEKAFRHLIRRPGNSWAQGASSAPSMAAAGK